MDSETFRENAYGMVDYIVDYMKSVDQRRVHSDIPSGYLKSVFPSTAPTAGEPFHKIMEDVEKHLLPFLSHPQHAGFHAYFPVSTSYPAILGTMLTDTFGFVGFNWNISPSGNELEVIMLNRLGKMLGLPHTFLRLKESRGAGMMCRSTKDCLFMAMITARQNKLKYLSHINPSMSKAALVHSLVAYCSVACNRCAISTANVSIIQVKFLETDENCRLRAETLAKAINEDKKSGLTPFFLCVNLVTSCGACDPIEELGVTCEKHGIWIHINATYCGIVLLCPEYRNLLKGIKYASSFNVNPDRGMLVPFDCAVLYVTDRFKVLDAMVMDKTIFGYCFSERDWGYPNKREFGVMKLFFVLEIYGVEGLQNMIRNRVRLAEMFASCVEKDERFETTSCRFGIVCFGLKRSDANANKYLLHEIISTGKLFLSPTFCGEKYVLRFVVCNERSTESDMATAWKIIQLCADNLCKADEKAFIDNDEQMNRHKCCFFR